MHQLSIWESDVLSPEAMNGRTRRADDVVHLKANAASSRQIYGVWNRLLSGRGDSRTTKRHQKDALV